MERFLIGSYLEGRQCEGQKMASQVPESTELLVADEDNAGPHSTAARIDKLNQLSTSFYF